MSDSATNDETFTQMAHSLMPFTKMLGLEVIEVTSERVLARGQWAAERCTSGGVLHGGYLIAIADAAGAACASLNLPQDEKMTTIESKTNFFRSVTKGVVEIIAVPVNIGRTAITMQTDILDDEKKPITRTTQT